MTREEKYQEWFNARFLEWTEKGRSFPTKVQLRDIKCIHFTEEGLVITHDTGKTATLSSDHPNNTGEELRLLALAFSKLECLENDPKNFTIVKPGDVFYLGEHGPYEANLAKGKEPGTIKYYSPGTQQYYVCSQGTLKEKEDTLRIIGNKNNPVNVPVKENEGLKMKPAKIKRTEKP